MLNPQKGTELPNPLSGTGIPHRSRTEADRSVPHWVMKQWAHPGSTCELKNYQV